MSDENDSWVKRTLGIDTSDFFGSDAGSSDAATTATMDASTGAPPQQTWGAPPTAPSEGNYTPPPDYHIAPPLGGFGEPPRAPGTIPPGAYNPAPQNPLQLNPPDITPPGITTPAPPTNPYDMGPPRLNVPGPGTPAGPDTGIWQPGKPNPFVRPDGTFDDGRPPIDPNCRPLPGQPDPTKKALPDEYWKTLPKAVSTPEWKKWQDAVEAWCKANHVDLGPILDMAKDKINEKKNDANDDLVQPDHKPTPDEKSPKFDPGSGNQPSPTNYGAPPTSSPDPPIWLPPKPTPDIGDFNLPSDDSALA